MSTPGPVVPPNKAKVAARNTFLQGLIAATILGACTGTLQVLNAGHFTWRTVAASVATATLTSVVAYIQHAYAAPYLRVRKEVRGGRSE